MLDNKSIKEFDAKLDAVTQQVIAEAKSRESWPQDEVPEVYEKIEQLSTELTLYADRGLNISELPASLCVAAMSMMQYDRALKFLSHYISDEASLSQLIAISNKSDTDAMNYAIILHNRVSLLAGAKLLERVFSPSRVAAINAALEIIDSK